MEALKLEDADKQQQLRQVMFETFCQQYQSLATFIQKMPFNAEMKGKISFFMDTAFLWTKESFILADIQANNAKLEAVPNDAGAAPLPN